LLKLSVESRAALGSVMRDRNPPLNLPGCALLALAVLAEACGLIWKDRNAIWPTGAAVVLAVASLCVMLSASRRRR
jgi:hypothetical protein